MRALKPITGLERYQKTMNILHEMSDLINQALMSFERDQGCEQHEATLSIQIKRLKEHTPLIETSSLELIDKACRSKKRRTWNRALTLGVPRCYADAFAVLKKDILENDPPDLVTLLHPEVKFNSFDHFTNDKLKDAVFNATLVLADMTRRKSGVTYDGVFMADKVFSPKDPMLVFSDVTSQLGNNEQAGFSSIMRGAFLSIRNVVAHSLMHRMDRIMAAQMLVFLSLLTRLVEECVVTEKAPAYLAPQGKA